MKIIADYREKRSGVIEALQKRQGIEIEIQPLSVGDYQVEGIRFERKTLRDFAASLKDGRLFRQAIRLASGKEKGIIILEGSSEALRNMDISREALQGALVTLSLVLGLTVLRSLSPDETAWLISIAADQSDRIEQRPLYRKGRKISGKEKWQVEVLQCLPGIGPAKAARLLQRFGSLKEVFAAEPKLWQEVPGIGSRLAKRMEWVIREA